MTFTILSIGRAMKDTPVPDYEAITHPFKGVEGYELPQIQEAFWRTFGYKATDSVPKRLY
jgi:hypothetical protein